MSDFGSIIYISKTDNSAFEASEIDEITVICKNIGKDIQLKNSMGEDYLFDVGKTINVSNNNCYTVNLLLSNYWGDSAQFKWHEKVELKDLDIIAAKVKEGLSMNYKVVPCFEWW